MKHLPLLFIFVSLNAVVAQAQCEADTTVYLTDFLFTPSEFTISVGQTVAFVNAEGTHNVDGTAESNPVYFFLEETEGNIDGVCMGTVTFDVPGTYTFSSSVGLQPVLGMVGTIVVDAETLCDAMLSFWGSGVFAFFCLAFWGNCVPMVPKKGVHIFRQTKFILLFKQHGASWAPFSHIHARNLGGRGFRSPHGLLQLNYSGVWPDTGLFYFTFSWPRWSRGGGRYKGTRGPKKFNLSSFGKAWCVKS